jgi:hypothetical protein
MVSHASKATYASPLTGEAGVIWRPTDFDLRSLPGAKNNLPKALPKWKFSRRPFNTRQDTFFAVVVDFEKFERLEERSSFV